MNKKISILTLGLITSLLSLNAVAIGNQAHLAVIVDGQPQKEYFTNNENKTYIAGEIGKQYSIQLKNPHNKRIMVVVSVDGLNVITGKQASVQDQGYIIEPYGNLDIKGWRKNMNQVAQFNFSTKEYSYSNRIGHGTKNDGVIGVAVFNERYIPQPFPEDKIYSGREKLGASNEAQSADSVAPSATPSVDYKTKEENGIAKRLPSGLGTGHGETVGSSASYSTFNKASNLVVKGIIQPSPEPFIDEPQGFAKDPNW